jgi:hypothetical protein
VCCKLASRLREKRRLVQASPMADDHDPKERALEHLGQYTAAIADYTESIAKAEQALENARAALRHGMTHAAHTGATVHEIAAAAGMTEREVEEQLAMED